MILTVYHFHKSSKMKYVIFRWIDSSRWKLTISYIQQTQPKLLPKKLDILTSIRGLHQKKLVLSSSSSWHDGKTLCQESGHMHGSVGSDGDRQRARAFYQMDQRGHTHPEGRTTGHEEWWGQLPTEPRIRPLSWHGVSPSCQELEELSTSFFWWRPVIEVETSSF